MVKNPPANARDTRDEVSIPGQEDPLEKEMATYSSVLPEKFLGQRSVMGYCPWGRRESDMTNRLRILFKKHRNLSASTLFL